MAQNAHRDDIRIGEDRWIHFVSVEGRQELAVSIDQRLAPLAEFLDRLESICLAECCGFGAYDFTPEGVRRAVAGLDASRLVSVIQDITGQIESLSEDVVVSERMNNYADKTVFLEILHHLHQCLSEAAADQ